MMSSARPAAVAGLFYPAERATLGAQVRQLLADVPDDAPSRRVPKLLVAPHAGYRYSGPVAAHAYSTLRQANGIRRVVLLGPAHTVYLSGIAAPRAPAFETPLGRVTIDHDAFAQLEDLAQPVVRDDVTHASEHALEVQLPFLQFVLGDGFSLVPMAVGRVPREAVARVLERLWGGDETLVVVSTDLSHYLPYQQARSVDRVTVDRILALDPDIEPQRACGAFALAGALEVARNRGLKPRLLDMRNSGDTAGDKRRVVGYASLAMEEPA
ncbi:MAG TPA: AmmeMemoRadiSam system protein B [Burkholderiaceae bacterium]|nr:AmmeMemoRadiSam system protein B [Burkholderiaceae bacterium]